MDRRSFNVLLVGDESRFGRLLGEAMAGATAEEFAEPRPGLECVPDLSLGLSRLAGRDIDLLAIDLASSEAGRLKRFLRLCERITSVPIILLTAHEEHELEPEFRDLRQQCVLIRPEKDDRLLLSLLRTALDRRRMVLELELRGQRLNAKESRFRTIIEKNADGMVILDRQGIIQFVNPAVEHIFGRRADELLGEMFGFPAVEGEPAEVDIVRRSGERVIAEMRAVEIEWEGDTAYLASLRDVTERKRTEAALRISEERYAVAARGANDGLWDWDLSTGLVYFSPRWKSMLGYEEHELEAHLEEWLERVHSADQLSLRESIDAHLLGLSPHFEHEYRIRRRDGSYCWMLSRGLAVRDENLNAVRIAGSQTDITKRKEAEAKLIHNAFHDGLTGLPNRALFMDRLGHSVERSRRRTEQFFATLFLDIDRFRHVNEIMGYAAGDELVLTTSTRLESCLRPGDTVARLGGGEFAVLLEDIDDVEDARLVSDRICREIARPLIINGREVRVTASIGIALSRATSMSAEELIRDAQTAMYRAKEGGKNRFEVFDPKMRTLAIDLLELEHDLRRAVERHEFRVFYQPMVDLRTNRITGFEALVRWIHPVRGLVPPNDFIPLAEDTGLIIDIGGFVLRDACSQLRVWHDQFPNASHITMSVNLSTRQFLQPDLVEQVSLALEDGGLPASFLKLEITESGFIENAEAANAMLIRLRAMGVKIQIDDFGTGYSALGYLRRFPINTLKIDQSFIKTVENRGENWEIVRTIVSLAHNLGMDVTAEGVETAEQAAELRNLRCESGQGYFFSRPVPSEDAGRLIATGSLGQPPTLL